MINKHNRIYSVLLFFLTRQTTSPSFLTKHINIISYTYNKRSNKFGVLKVFKTRLGHPANEPFIVLSQSPNVPKRITTIQRRADDIITLAKPASQPAHHMYTIAKWLRWDISLQHNFEYHKTSRFVDVVYIHTCSGRRLGLRLIWSGVYLPRILNNNNLFKTVFKTNYLIFLFHLNIFFSFISFFHKKIKKN